MESLALNAMLGREGLANALVQSIRQFFLNRNNPMAQRGVYVHGSPGIGKTEFVMRVLKSAGYDVVRYDAGDIRNKAVIENITKHHMPDVNIMSLWKMQSKKIVIVMDEIDGMNNGDKGGITALVKLIRPKKTKKQRTENNNYNPIVCISNNHVDKKITELMKACDVIELPTPSVTQMELLVNELMPSLAKHLRVQISEHVNGDLRRLSMINGMVKKGMHLDEHLFEKVFSCKSQNEDAKQIVKRVLNEKHSVCQHSTLMHETDRTIVGLLWHENVIDVLKKQKLCKATSVYDQLLSNICKADYVDRVTFQKQIWQFNEMSSLIRTMHGQSIYHDAFDKKPVYNPSEVRFTRVLTKYSTEFNNFTFIQNLCQKLGLDRIDLIAYFMGLRRKLAGDDADRLTEAEMLVALSQYDVSKLEVDRMFRLLEKGFGTDKTRQTTKNEYAENEIVNS